MIDLELHLVEVTKAAALAAAPWIGKNDKLSADKAASDAMRKVLNTLPISGTVTIGEGKKDQSFGLFAGETVGLGGMEVQLAVDPIDGTTPLSRGEREAVSVIAAAEWMFATEDHYCRKLVVGPDVHAHITEPLENIIHQVAYQKNKSLHDIVVCLLNRKRNQEFIEIAQSICQVVLIENCDITPSILTCIPNSGIDIYYGIGGAPEAVLSAAAVKSRGGSLEIQRINLSDSSPDSQGVVIEDLIGGNCWFAMSGITDGSLLEGVRDGKVKSLAFSNF